MPVAHQANLEALHMEQDRTRHQLVQALYSSSNCTTSRIREHNRSNRKHPSSPAISLTNQLSSQVHLLALGGLLRIGISITELK